MRNIIYVGLALIAVCCVPLGTHASPAPEGVPLGTYPVFEHSKIPTAPKLLYRIRVEEGITPPDGIPFTDHEERQIKKLNDLLIRWPRLVWIGSNDGKLVIVKIGPNGQPMKAVKP